MNRYLLICIVIFPISLSGQDFSVEAIINHGHAVSQESWGESNNYCRSVLWSKHEQLNSEKKYHHLPLTISIPDSLAEKWFRIKKGEGVVQIYDGKITGSDTISGFEAMMGPNGNIVLYLKLHRLESRHLNWYDTGRTCYFYVIGAGDVKISPLSFPKDPLNDWLLTKVSDYFNEHEDSKDVKRIFNSDVEQEPDFLELHRIKVSFKDFCETKLMSIHVDDDQSLDYIFTSDRKARECNFSDFSFIMVSSLNSPFLIPSSHFEFAVEVEKRRFLLFKVWVPDTGGHGRNLYVFDPERNEMMLAFGDWTWSN